MRKQPAAHTKLARRNPIGSFPSDVDACLAHPEINKEPLPKCQPKADPSGPVAVENLCVYNAPWELQTVPTESTMNCDTFAGFGGQQPAGWTGCDWATWSYICSGVNKTQIASGTTGDNYHFTNRRVTTRIVPEGEGADTGLQNVITICSQEAAAPYLQNNDQAGAEQAVKDAMAKHFGFGTCTADAHLARPQQAV